MQPLSLPGELLQSAEHLLCEPGVATTEANLRRAWSSIYYSLFHFMCGTCADNFVGDEDHCRSQRAWHQVYRAPDHGQCKNHFLKIIRENDDLTFPDAIKDFAALFITLQEKRHAADYDLRSDVSPTDIRVYINDVGAIIESMQAVDKKHKVALAVYLLVGHRKK